MADAAPLQPPPPGVLIIDKPPGYTSHDVVARVRKTLREKRIGHAGTLDPMATGVLVVLVGEGTKLAPYLTAADKRYLARITFGIATATLDADGPILARADVPPDLLDEIRALATHPSGLPDGRIAAALQHEIARTEQIPPAYSAIHIDGERSHERARAGEEVTLPPRPVAVRSLRLIGARAAAGEPPSIEVEVAVSKGYYVRSLARDVGEQLGLPAHLSQLRRTRSGAFAVENAVSLDAGAQVLRAAIVPLAPAIALALPVARLTAEGAVRARHGKLLGTADFRAEASPPEDSASAWLDENGRLVAIGEPGEGGFSVLRGFAAT